MEENKLEDKEALGKLKEIVSEVKVAMMCTTGENGDIHGRPMSTAGMDGDGVLWFFTNDPSEKAAEIEHERGISLCYSDPSASTYACIQGTARVVNNDSKKNEYWNPALKAWFPGGVDDPNLSMIKVKPHHGEYWDSSSSKMVVFLKMARAVVTGKKYTDDKGSHGKMEL